MTLRIEISNRGPYDAVVNVWETDSPRSEGKNVERYDLKIGESCEVTVFGWQRGVTVLEASGESDPDTQDVSAKMGAIE